MSSKRSKGQIRRRSTTRRHATVPLWEKLPAGIMTAAGRGWAAGAGRHAVRHAWPCKAPLLTWWSQRGGPTRPHSELGRETPQRPGYCRSIGGRAGRRQVWRGATSRPPDPSPTLSCTRRGHPPAAPHLAAGWSSPVARQAHNLKVVGSNPTPATTDIPRPGTPVPGRSLLRSPASQNCRMRARSPCSVTASVPF
jgi:hypothetical protein